MGSVESKSELLSQEDSSPKITYLRPLTTGLSVAALEILAALMRSKGVGSLCGSCARRFPSATEKIEAPSTLHLCNVRAKGSARRQCREGERTHCDTLCGRKHLENNW